jgi:hypothetical protein
MGIDARATPKVAPDLLLELSNHLRLSESNYSFSEAMAAAIHSWIVADQQQRPQAVPHSRGYQWKSLFLTAPQSKSQGKRRPGRGLQLRLVW